VRELTGGLGADAVFDFVGVQPTIDTARESVAIDGFIHIVGIGGGILPAGFFSTPFGAAVRNPYWGSRSELAEVLDLARTGAVAVHVEQYGFDTAVEAYGKLHHGQVRGRAVVVP
jgi:propanol-preferring alcohol dehydrogenase